MEFDLEKIFGDSIDDLIRDKFLSDDFLDMMNENSAPFNKMMSCYRCAIMEVETKFKVLNEQFSLVSERNPIESIKSRVKSMDSLLRKIRDKNIPLTIESVEENIFDIAGVRVICSFPSDIYAIADSFLRQDDITLIQKKDYIHDPKGNGYRSLHLIVSVPIFLQNETKEMKVEVQLRTIAMDFWASLEHKLKYKKHLSPEIIAELSEELQDCARISSELDLRMQKIRDRIMENEEKEVKKPPRLPFMIESRENRWI